MLSFHFIVGESGLRTMCLSKFRTSFWGCLWHQLSAGQVASLSLLKEPFGCAISRAMCAAGPGSRGRRVQGTVLCWGSLLLSAANTSSCPEASTLHWEIFRTWEGETYSQPGEHWESEVFIAVVGIWQSCSVGIIAGSVELEGRSGVWLQASISRRFLPRPSHLSPHCPNAFYLICRKNKSLWINGEPFSTVTGFPMGAQRLHLQRRIHLVISLGWKFKCQKAPCLITACLEFTILASLCVL